MVKRLSFQQVQILRRLNDNPCSVREMGNLYVGCNIYRALSILTKKGLIVKSGKKYELTERGEIALKLS